MDLAVTLIDTALAYGRGHSEELVGRTADGTADCSAGRELSSARVECQGATGPRLIALGDRHHEGIHQC